VAISNLYKLTNAMTTSLAQEQKSADLQGALREAAEILVLLMAPMMPHLAEECWAVLGHQTPVVDTPWPKALAELLVVDEVTIGIQVNGKRRDEITVSKGLDQKVLEAQVLELEGVKRAMEGKPARKVIIVPDRIVNIVC
jgi:leucyl-tRNA synthetase